MLELKTYLFPFGGKSFFIALKKGVRAAENVGLGDSVTI